ncbi:30S ribosomal protein S24e [Candidatus Woesearchaeota archaeon]|nr:30S ribosomal protein S24e [Candidatus Woesearchaeota archaeon]
MDIKIIQEKEFPFLDRKLVEAEITFKETTPNRMDVRKSVAAKAGAKEELVVVREIKNKYGRGLAQVKAYIYNDEASMKKVETPEMIKKNSPKVKGED